MVKYFQCFTLYQSSLENREIDIFKKKKIRFIIRITKKRREKVLQNSIVGGISVIFFRCHEVNKICHELYVKKGKHH